MVKDESRIVKGVRKRHRYALRGGEGAWVHLMTAEDWARVDEELAEEWEAWVGEVSNE